MAGKSASVNINIVADASKAVRGFKDAGSAGEAMEKALKKAADKMEAELEQTAKIAQALAHRLGPGFRTTVGETPEDIARRFARTGLTLEELDSNIDGITDQLRRLEAQADDTGREMDQIGTNATKAGDATRSMAGNAVGDLAAMGAGVGPVGEAIGQLTEGVLSGQIAFKQLATAGLAVGGITAVLGGVNYIMAAFAKEAEKSRKQAEGLQQTFDLLLDMKKEEAARQLFETFGDLYKQMAKSGVPASLLTRALTGQSGALEELAARLDATLTEEQAYADGTYTIAELDALARRRIVENVEKQAKAFQNLLPQYLAEEQAVADIAANLKDFGINTGDATDDINGMTEAVKDQVSWVDWLDSTWSAFWDKLDAQALTRDLYSALFLDEADLERQVELVGRYVQDVLKLPPDVMDRLIPMIEQGQVDAVWSMVTALQRIRDMVSSGSTRMGEAALAGLGFVPGYANGTMSARPGLALVGENGPELVQFGGGERVYPTGTGPMGGTVNVTVNMPAGSDGDDVVRALQRWTRSNGALPLPVTSTAVR